MSPGFAGCHVPTDRRHRIQGPFLSQAALPAAIACAIGPRAAQLSRGVGSR